MKNKLCLDYMRNIFENNPKAKVRVMWSFEIDGGRANAENTFTMSQLKDLEEKVNEGAVIQRVEQL